MFTIAGQDNHDEVSPSSSLSYEGSGAGKVIMPKLRPGTHESRK
jgi:hypothetical protein